MDRQPCDAACLVRSSEYSNRGAADRASSIQAALGHGCCPGLHRHDFHNRAWVGQYAQADIEMVRGGLTPGRLSHLTYATEIASVISAVISSRKC